MALTGICLGLKKLSGNMGDEILRYTWVGLCRLCVPCLMAVIYVASEFLIRMLMK